MIFWGSKVCWFFCSHHIKLWSINVNPRLLRATVEFVWGGVCTVIFESNPTTVLRLCCVVVGVLTKLNKSCVILSSSMGKTSEPGLYECFGWDTYSHSLDKYWVRKIKPTWLESFPCIWKFLNSGENFSVEYSQKVFGLVALLNRNRRANKYNKTKVTLGLRSYI